MPHLIVETTRQLAGRIDFPGVFAGLHREMAALGYARLEDFKSRVLVAEAALVGGDAATGFLVAHLVMTNARPEAMQAAMADLILARLAACVEKAAPAGEVQVCVLHRQAAPGSYRKTVVAGSR
ncbi:hypothetical protein [Cupriavidus sp. WS]|uniref:hypothetical protein n=1 Tax=Cupriavidus sp. WS TaxID=1312922 RepID=UPI00036A433D|nr:hypothetical protein [Cupriavidus sp. WS]